MIPTLNDLIKNKFSGILNNTIIKSNINMEITIPAEKDSCIREELNINLENYTVLAGVNNSGKTKTKKFIEFLEIKIAMMQRRSKKLKKKVFYCHTTHLQK